jgi:hypothetical protein
MDNFYPRLFNEGVADKYAEKEFFIPNETKSQEDTISKKIIKNENKIVVHGDRWVIVKNPDSLKYFDDSVRAIFSKKGDLYVAKGYVVHTLMLEELDKVGEVINVDRWWHKNPKEFIALQRVYKSKDEFCLGESNDTMDPYLEETTREHYKMPYFEECQAYFQEWIDRANQLHPEFTFINKLERNINSREED